MHCDFQRKRVLVVEDDFLIASEIADALESANAIVLGPCGTLEDADLQVAHSDLALLDVRLRGRSSFGLADRLFVLDVPYVFFTGYDRAMLPTRFAGVDVITKPIAPQLAVQRLEIASRDKCEPSIVELVPLLRERARAHLSDPLAADRLIERTLQLAIAEAECAPVGANLVPWLLQRMERLLDAGSSQFLN